MTGVTLAFLRHHWDRVYDFTREDGQYVATARYGQRDRLTAATPEELLSLVRRHYRDNATRRPRALAPHALARAGPALAGAPWPACLPGPAAQPGRVPPARPTPAQPTPATSPRPPTTPAPSSPGKTSY